MAIGSRILKKFRPEGRNPYEESGTIDFAGISGTS
jgi:hypothetical protein